MDASPELAPVEGREDVRRAAISLHFPEVSLPPLPADAVTASESVPSLPANQGQQSRWTARLPTGESRTRRGNDHRDVQLGF